MTVVWSTGAQEQNETIQKQGVSIKDMNKLWLIQIRHFMYIIAIFFLLRDFIVCHLTLFLFCILIIIIIVMIFVIILKIIVIFVCYYKNSEKQDLWELSQGRARTQV